MNPFKEKKDFLTALWHMKENASSQKEQQQTKRKEMEVTCSHCESHLRFADLAQNLYVCPLCGHHFTVPARYRINHIADPGSFREICGSLKGGNPLDFPEYNAKLEKARSQTGLREAVVTGTCRIDGIKTVLAVMDNRFLMGSMGSAVGEKITRVAEYATKNRLPFVLFATSGGARMQEGILSLFQMAKTSAAIARHHEAGLFFLSILTNPTTGGVTASFASLGDIILAEPGALIGFAGPRVIEQTIREALPEGFQRAEYLKEHGFVDQVVERKDMRDAIALLLKIHQRRGKHERNG